MLSANKDTTKSQTTTPVKDVTFFQKEIPWILDTGAEDILLLPHNLTPHNLILPEVACQIEQSEFALTLSILQAPTFNHANIPAYTERSKPCTFGITLNNYHRSKWT